MINIIITGRAGQGVVLASQLLAMAAHEEGYHCQAIPQFGGERTGQPVKSYVRISKSEIKTLAPIEKADYILLIDPLLFEPLNILSLIKEDGIIIINTSKNYTNKDYKIRCIDINSIITNSSKGINVGMLAAFTAITKVITINALNRAINTRFSDEIAKKNVSIAEAVYEKIK